ncbi:hypothetical protein AIOGIFDO_01335 [Candidatus Methanoperedenaceae archaeon GB37]|nr:hypothetical protein AIOGIFDO_01335 [Candidatus Methanoperedenaceae archaeon GB37]
MMKRMSIAIACLMVVLTFGILVPASAAATNVYVDPATVTSDNCETVSIMIETDEAAGIGSATMTLVYDPLVVDYNGKVADGDLGGVTINENPVGTLTLTAATGASPGPTGTVKFVELEFCPVGTAGECSDLDLTVTELTDGTAGNPQVIVPDSVTDGEFCVAGVPPAGTDVYVDPATVTSDNCETVSIMIETDEAAGIGSATMTLVYDPLVVDYNGKVADGDLGGVTINENPVGTLTLTAATGASPGPTGTVKFVELEFCPVGTAGECSDLDLTVTELTDGTAGNPQVIVPDSVTDGEFCVAGVPPAGTDVYVDPATVTSDNCETVSIMIETDEAAGIGSATMTLVYDPLVVDYNGKVADGDLGTVEINENPVGTLTMVAATGASPGPTGTVKFVELEFCPVGDPGECSDLDLTVTELTDGTIGNPQVIVPDSVTDGEFCILNGDVSPAPQIIEPVDGDEVCGVVTVTVVDNSGEGDIEYCLIEYFNGTEWIEIVNDTTAPYGGDWDTSELSPGEYTVRATMKDAAGQTGADEITVTIPPCCDADFVLELEAGWNLVSVPAWINGSKNAVDVFNLSVSGFESCWYYDACEGEWFSNSDVSVEPCRGYWVLKENAETLCLDLNESAGPSDIPSQDLCEGWNLIGYTSSVAIDDGTAGDFKSVSTLEDTFAQLWTYSQTSGWLGYPSWGLDRLEPGEGAWILMTEDATMHGTPYV